MADTTVKDDNKDAKKGISAQINEIFDPISGLLEGIGQTVHDLLKDRKLWELLLMGLAGGWGFTMLVDKLGDLIKQDDGKRILARQMQRKALYQLLLKKGETCWDGIVKGYKHLRELGFDEADITTALTDLAEWRQHSIQRRQNAQRLSRWTFRIGIPSLILLLLCVTAKPELLVYVAIAVVSIIIIAGIVLAIANRGNGNQRISYQDHPLTTLNGGK